MRGLGCCLVDVNVIVRRRVSTRRRMWRWGWGVLSLSVVGCVRSVTVGLAAFVWAGGCCSLSAYPAVGRQIARSGGDRCGEPAMDRIDGGGLCSEFSLTQSIRVRLVGG